MFIEEIAASNKLYHIRSYNPSRMTHGYYTSLKRAKRDLKRLRQYLYKIHKEEFSDDDRSDEEQMRSIEEATEIEETGFNINSFNVKGIHK